MALTLGELRAFCAEVASPDSAGASADREFMIWINAALLRCYTELHWDRLQFENKITVVPPVTVCCAPAGAAIAAVARAAGVSNLRTSVIHASEDRS
jgi:hypothetical protein